VTLVDVLDLAIARLEQRNTAEHDDDGGDVWFGGTDEREWSPDDDVKVNGRTDGRRTAKSDGHDIGAR
jgi:hypothetical protein